MLVVLQLRCYVLKLQLCDEARHSGGLQLNLDHLGSFDVRRNSNAGAFSVSRLHQKNGRCGRDRYRYTGSAAHRLCHRATTFIRREPEELNSSSNEETGGA